jgi:hypothetical protein
MNTIYFIMSELLGHVDTSVNKFFLQRLQPPYAL